MSNHLTDTLEHVDKAAALTGKAAVTTGGGTAMASLLPSLNDIALLVGIATSIITCAAYVYFKWKHYQLARAEFERGV